MQRPHHHKAWGMERAGGLLNRCSCSPLNQITQSSSWARTAWMLTEWLSGQQKQIRLNKIATSCSLVSLWSLKIKGILTSGYLSLWMLVSVFMKTQECVFSCSCFLVYETSSLQLGVASVTQIESWTFDLLQLTRNRLLKLWQWTKHYCHRWVQVPHPIPQKFWSDSILIVLLFFNYLELKKTTFYSSR